MYRHVDFAKKNKSASQINLSIASIPTAPKSDILLQANIVYNIQ